MALEKKDRLHYAVAQAVVLDPYARAVIKNRAELQKTIGETGFPKDFSMSGFFFRWVGAGIVLS